MESAKNAVKDFVKNHGKKDTTVHEQVQPAVTHETVKPTRHEEITTAVDKEVHQDHYHTTVQPVKDSEVLPEKHTHNIVPVEHRKFERNDNDEIQRSVDAEAARFRDEQVVAATVNTTSAAPVVGSEHKHHHVHETIQPVIQKETIQPEVVHTTVPVHEVHENAPQHHAASALPAMSMAEFKAKGGSLEGRGERSDHFEGEPRIASGSAFGDGSYTDARGVTGSGTTTSDYAQTGTTTAGTKPSLLEKLDPRKDADGDGKKGLMD